MEDKMSPLLSERRVLLRNRKELRNQLETWPQNEITKQETIADIHHLDTLYVSIMNKIKMEYINQQQRSIFWSASKELIDELEKMPTIQNKPTQYTEPMTPEL